MDGGPKNLREERLAAITAAENALRAKENENGNLDRKTNSSDNASDQSTIKDEIITIQPSQNMKQKESEQIGSSIQPNTTPLSSDSLQTQDNPVNSRPPQSREDLKGHQYRESRQGESKTEQQVQEAVKGQESKRPQENVMAPKDKVVADSRIPGSDVRENELSSRSSNQTHTDDSRAEKNR